MTKWVTVTEAADHLGMSVSEFRTEVISVHRQAVNAGQTDVHPVRSRVTKVSDTTRREIQADSKPGVAVMDMMSARFGWSDGDIADALGLSPSTVPRYRLKGVTEHRVRVVGKLARMPAEDTAIPRPVRREQRKTKRSSLAKKPSARQEDR
jgi:hypothetical protein